MDRVSPPTAPSPLAWLPFLWRSVLFPGAVPQAVTPVRPLAVLLLLMLPALLLYPCLSFRLLEPDEGRYAEIPREMLERGDLLVPVLHGEPYLDKPPLFYWLVAGSYRLFGVSEASARLVPALAVHATILLVYLLGRRSLGDKAAFRGAILLTLAPGFVSVARLLVLDGLLTLWATLAVLSALEALRGARFGWGWWLTASLACALGVLTKGPVAAVLLLPPVLLRRWLDRDGVAVPWSAWLASVAVLLAVNVPWYAALCVRIPGFARYFFWEQHVVRFLTPYAHEQGVFYYGPILLGGLLPGTLLLWPVLRFLLGGGEEAARLRARELGAVLLAGGWCVLFFTLSACKLPTYVLPALPLLALVLGYFLAHGPWNRSRTLLPTAAAAFVLLLFFHHVALPWYAADRSPMARADELRAICDDPTAKVVCYPRPVDSVAFYLRRDDLRNYRSADIENLRTLVRDQPRTVILCTHRHSLKGLQELLPPEVQATPVLHLGLSDVPGVPSRWQKPLKQDMGETALGLSDVAIVERRH
jgi:4-amino-4-deoxy-L-arabinose transferase-like glycosyltransferase